MTNVTAPAPVNCTACGKQVRPETVDAGFRVFVYELPVDEQGRCSECAWLETKP